MSNGISTTYTRGKGKRGKKYLQVHRGPQRGQYLHRMIAEAMMGRPLQIDEVVDHIDGSSFNNHPKNLRVTTVIGNSRRKYALPLGEEIFNGNDWWEGRDPWIVKERKLHARE